MIGRTSLLKATALSLSLGLAATAARAGSIADVAKQTDELSMFSEAITAAGLDRQLAGEGPFTVFAPTNQAFEQLPKGALEELMKQENQAQLSKLLEHHVVQGEALAAEEVVGRQTKLDTMSGDTLTVDATSGAVLLVPTGLTIAQVGDQLVIEREAWPYRPTRSRSRTRWSGRPATSNSGSRGSSRRRSWRRRKLPPRPSRRTCR
jgi:Fasciclin domain